MNSSKVNSAERNFENCLARRASLFSVQRLVTLGKTNAFGGAYFAEFFVWTGEAREELLAKAGGFDGVTFHTSEAHMKYFRELMPFQHFDIVVWPRAKRMSLAVRFFFIRANELIAVGDQEIALKSDGRLLALPPSFTHFVSQFDPF